jgi:hypothetical protein
MQNGSQEKERGKKELAVNEVPLWCLSKRQRVEIKYGIRGQREIQAWLAKLVSRKTQEIPAEDVGSALLLARTWDTKIQGRSLWLTD